MAMQLSLCGVLVTFNRLEKLKKTIEAYEKQSLLPKYLVVIDNCSTDGTKEYLDEWMKEKKEFEKIVIHMESNTGGSGGFYKGIEEAQKLDVEWIYLSDDDAYLTDNALETFYNRKERLDSTIGVIASTVDAPDGITLLHRRVAKLSKLAFKEVYSKEEDYKMDSFPIDMFSFVGVFIRKEACVEAGLPMKDYFIWYDDTEYSYRITRKYKAVCIPSIVVFHDCKMADITFCWKNYYGYRNNLDFLRRDLNKRYYNYFKFALWVSSILDIFKGKSKKGKVKREAIKDAKKGILGINNKYLPGKKF